MSYSVVYSLKKRKCNIVKIFTAAPSKWIINGDLYWPKNNLNLLLADPYSNPDLKSWTSTPYYESRRLISTYSEALMWEKKYTEIDTEDEQSMNVYNNKNVADYDKAFDDQFEKLASPNVECEYLEPISSITYKDGFSSSSSSSIFQPMSSTPTTIKQDTTAYVMQYLECEKRNDNTTAILNKVVAEMASIRLILERIETSQHLNVQPDNSNQIQEEILSKKLNFPINELSILQPLETTLAENKEYKKYLIQHFGKICGMNGNEKSPNNLSIKLASELLFTKKLLTECSWTGISRTSSVSEKFPFRTLRAILMTVEEIMRNADCRWNREDTDKLFRDKLLKHAKKGNEAHEKKICGKNKIELTTENVDEILQNLP